MTREEKQKAIDALKISVPIKALTQEEFNDYIQTLNKVMDWLEQEPTTKNDLGVDCISRFEVTEILNSEYDIDKMLDRVDELPSVTPQEPQTFKWCETCKEYDQEKHCYHRWSKVIRDTVEEMRQEPILDKIRAEIIKYEGDCRLSVDEYPSCKQCTDNVFKTIYGILDKYKAESEPQESEG